MVVYNAHMSENLPETTSPAEAAKFFVKNSKEIDVDLMVANFAAKNPRGFISFLAEHFGIDGVDIAGQLARLNPDSFMVLATAQREVHRGVAKSINALLNGNKVQSIKECRGAFALGLKEAKDIVDLVQEQMVKRGLIGGPPYTISMPSLTPDLQAIYQQYVQYLDTHNG